MRNPKALRTDNVANKPVTALRAFTSSLGWPGLRMYQQILPADAMRAMPTTVTWYEAGERGSSRSDFFLQINECLGKELSVGIAVNG